MGSGTVLKNIFRAEALCSFDRLLPRPEVQGNSNQKMIINEVRIITMNRIYK